MSANKPQVDVLIKLFHRGTKLTYAKGEYIIRPGEAPNGVLFIDEGLVKAFNISKYGEENLLIIRRRHEIFPLIWAVTGKERNIIYQTLAPTTVWRIDKTTYLNFLHKNIEAMELMLNMVTEMYRIHSERLLNLEYRSVRERLASFLYTMAARFGEKTSAGVLIAVPLRHQDIASSINSSRETTSRELARLERKNILKNKQLHIVLTDTKKLRALFE